MFIKRKKHILIAASIGLLYFIGVAALVYPMIGNVYSLTTSRAEISSYNDAIGSLKNDEIEQKLRRAEEYNRKLYQGTFDEPLSETLNLRDNIMCYVEVPSVEIYLPVYYGTKEDVLRKGAGWLEKTSLPVEGESVHSVIAGHTGLPNAEMFTKLDQVGKGETFRLTVLDRTFSYRIISIESVTPDRTDLLMIEKGKNYVTLLTCTPYGINDKRLLLKGELIDVQTPEHQGTSPSPGEGVRTNAFDAADTGLQNQISGVLTMILVVTIGAVAVFAAACVWLHFVIKKRSVPGAALTVMAEADDGKEKE